MSQCRAKSRIWVSDSAPGSSMLERSVGSSGTSVSSGFAVRWLGDSGGWRLGSWQCCRASGSSSSASGELRVVIYGSWMAAHGASSFRNSSARPSSTWILSALSVVSSVLEDFKCRWRFSVAVVDRSSGLLG
ncbi:unnamed protein product [Brassica rapa subsp. trilocularis]